MQLQANDIYGGVVGTVLASVIVAAMPLGENPGRSALWVCVSIAITAIARSYGQHVSTHSADSASGFWADLERNMLTGIPLVIACLPTILILLLAHLLGWHDDIVYPDGSITVGYTTVILVVNMGLLFGWGSRARREIGCVPQGGHHRVSRVARLIAQPEIVLGSGDMRRTLVNTAGVLKKLPDGDPVDVNSVAVEQLWQPLLNGVVERESMFADYHEDNGGDHRLGQAPDAEIPLSRNILHGNSIRVSRYRCPIRPGTRDPGLHSRGSQRNDRTYVALQSARIRFATTPADRQGRREHHGQDCVAHRFPFRIAAEAIDATHPATSLRGTATRSPRSTD